MGYRAVKTEERSPAAMDSQVSRAGRMAARARLSVAARVEERMGMEWVVLVR